MGNKNSHSLAAVSENPNRKVFITFNSYRTVESSFFGTYEVYRFTIRYQRYEWSIDLRFNEIARIDKRLLIDYPSIVTSINRPQKINKILWNHDKNFLDKRATAMCCYLQDILDQPQIFLESKLFRETLRISASSFNPDLGRKGREGYLLKCSGGFNEKYSNRIGDYINLWKWRWIVLTDNAILWYNRPTDKLPTGNLQIDQAFQAVRAGRVITIRTACRKLLLTASTERDAQEWVNELETFYEFSKRKLEQPFVSSYPPRYNTEVKAYTYPRDYFTAVAVALLAAQKEILIASWKNTPTVLLTRPPLPPLRLDQILKHKADQGVKVYILLYKEVEGVGQSNASGPAKQYFESLSKNIRCMRHPNKFYGGSTAVWWSHHEKLVVVDR